MKLRLQLSDRLNRSIAERRFKRKVQSKHKAKSKRCNLTNNGRKLIDRLLVPFVFNIRAPKNRKTFLKFISKLRTTTLTMKRAVVLDFNKCAYVNSSAMLLFVAELDRIKRILKDEFSVRIENVNKRIVNQVLEQVGVYKLCETPRGEYDSTTFDESVKHWRYATGERVNEQATKAFENIEGLLSPELAKGMWKSLSEAVVNSVEHAYVAPRGVPGPRMGHSRWWMFSEERDDELSVVACDLGIGIPRSLPLNWQPTLLQRLKDSVIGEGPDVRSIRAALKLGATSTGKTHRGKGLPQIWNTLKDQGGSVSIHSNCGILTWNAEKGEEFSQEFETSIFGTIISWTVPTKTAHGIENEV